MPGVTLTGLLGLLGVILLAGAILGIGCNAGCNYVRSHVNVEWQP